MPILMDKARYFRPGALSALCISLVLIASVHISCQKTGAKKDLVVAGSTSIQPFADRWAEIYMQRYPGKVVNVQGGGSSAGIQAARSGAADIGMSSRELKAEEHDLTETVVARDGLAIIIHPSNDISDMSLSQVQQIFAGKIKNWQEFGGRDRTIDVVTREEGSGTRGAFQELVMGKTRIFKGAIVEDSNGTVREIVSGDPFSIGYISLGLVNEKVKSLSLDGIRATDENILKNQYKLVRPFLFVSNGPPKKEAKDFIDFVLSAEGQDLIKKEGLLPVVQR